MRSIADIVASSSRVPLELARKAEELSREYQRAHRDDEERLGSEEWSRRRWDMLADAIGVEFAAQFAKYEARATFHSCHWTVEEWVDRWRAAKAVH